jgi:hypothetical protein
MNAHALTTLISCESLLDLTPLSLAEERRFCQAKVLSTLQEAIKKSLQRINDQILWKTVDLLIIDDWINFPLTRDS